MRSGNRPVPTLLGLVAIWFGVGNAIAPRLQTAASPPQAPTFRGGTTTVEVDVIVKDAAGKFVVDLGPRDFQVIEDATPRGIDTFYLVTGPGAASASRQSQPREEPLPSGTSTPPPAAVQRVFVFSFDVEHMATGSVIRAQKAVTEFLTTQFQAGDVGGIVVAGTMVNKRLTSVGEELRAAVASIKPTPDARSRELDMRAWPRIESLYEATRVSVGDDKVIEHLVYRACADDKDRCDDALPQILGKGRAIAGQARISAQRTLSTLKHLVVGLAPMPGRKTIVYLTDGFSSEDLAGELQTVIGRAALANVRIYAIDTRGLNRGSADSRILDAAPQERVVVSPGMPAGVPQFDIGSDGPNSLAVDTGGLFIRNENDFPRALRDIASDTSSYYVLGYQSAVPRDGKFHSIRVTVKRPGLTVRARKGYLAVADSAPIPASALTQPPTPNQPAPVVANATPPSASPAPAVAPLAPPPRAAMDVPTITAALGTKAGADLDGVRLRPVGRAPVDDATRLREGTPVASTTQPMPDSVIAQILEGWAAYERGDTRTALSVLTTPAENPAAPPWVNYVLGWSAFAEGQWVAARNAWNVVRTAVPDFVPVYFDIADAYLRQAKTGEALVVLRAAEKRWPGSVEVLNAVGVVQTSLGQLDEAVGTFEKALVAEPNDTSTRFNLGGAKELRYVRSLQQPPPAEADRIDAIKEYRRVASSSSTLAEAGKAGLRRLIPLDVRSLKYAAPVAVATLAQTNLHGRPVRLAWSPDGQQVYVWGMSSRAEGHVSVSVPAGAVTQLPTAPDWSKRVLVVEGRSEGALAPLVGDQVRNEADHGFQLERPGKHSARIRGVRRAIHLERAGLARSDHRRGNLQLRARWSDVLVVAVCDGCSGVSDPPQPLGNHRQRGAEDRGCRHTRRPPAGMV